ncbi:unnamed protein product [Larinioides sclopetarius]|uniref:Uncharacterized protein n=1 Tax=Larinioides sclopetarius TaxID=280406 RepID=A0AAV1YPF5_9ARAC
MQGQDKCRRGKNKEENSRRCLCASVRERYLPYIGCGEQHGALKCFNPRTNRQTGDRALPVEDGKVCAPPHSKQQFRQGRKFASFSLRGKFPGMKYIETFVIPLDKLQKAIQEKLGALHTEEAFNGYWRKTTQQVNAQYTNTPFGRGDYIRVHWATTIKQMALLQ